MTYGRIMTLEDVLDETPLEFVNTVVVPTPPPGALTEEKFEREQRRRNNRAKKLLLSLLDENQRWYLRYRGVIPVVSSTGEKWRIVCNNIVANVCRDGSKRGYCALLPTPPVRIEEVWHPAYGFLDRCYRMPYADHWIAQMLALQTNQRNFIQTAHCYYPWQHLNGLPGEKGNRIEVIW